MKSTNRVYLFALSFAFIAAQVNLAQAAPTSSKSSAGSTWEVSGGTRANFSFSSFNPVAWNYSVSAKVGYMLPMAGMQIVLGPTFSHLFVPASTWVAALNVDVGIRLNSSFSSDIKDDFFLFLGAQITNIPGVVSTATTTTNQTVGAFFEAELGKRFSITDSVTFAPSVTFLAGNSVQLAITPVQFSLLF